MTTQLPDQRSPRKRGGFLLSTARLGTSGWQSRSSRMDIADFNKTVETALRYFTLQGIEHADLRRALGQYVLELFAEGETRPLMLANRAIERLERQLDAELELSLETMDVVFNHA